MVWFQKDYLEYLTFSFAAINFSMSNDIDTFFSCELLFSDLLISDGIGGNFFAIYDFVKLIAADVLVVLLDILLSALSVSLLLSFDHSFYMNCN